MKLASSDDIKAAVVLHPGRLTIDEINGKVSTFCSFIILSSFHIDLFTKEKHVSDVVLEVKVPIAFLGAEFDHASPPEQLKEFGEILSKKSEVNGSSNCRFYVLKNQQLCSFSGMLHLAGINIDCLLLVQSESSVKIFPGVSHGWTVRYNIDDESAVKSAEEAHCDMLNWFTKYVK